MPVNFNLKFPVCLFFVKVNKRKMFAYSPKKSARAIKPQESFEVQKGALEKRCATLFSNKLRTALQKKCKNSLARVGDTADNRSPRVVDRERDQHELMRPCSAECVTRAYCIDTFRESSAVTPSTMSPKRPKISRDSHRFERVSAQKTSVITRPGGPSLRVLGEGAMAAANYQKNEEEADQVVMPYTSRPPRIAGEPTPSIHRMVKGLSNSSPRIVSEKAHTLLFEFNNIVSPRSNSTAEVAAGRVPSRFRHVENSPSTVPTGTSAVHPIKSIVPCTSVMPPPDHPFPERNVPCPPSRPASARRPLAATLKATEKGSAIPVNMENWKFLVRQLSRTHAKFVDVCPPSSFTLRQRMSSRSNIAL